MYIKFKKELAAKQDGSKYTRYVYRALDRPQFTVCAEGFEWASNTEGKEGAIIEIEVTVTRRICHTCSGTGQET